MMRQVREQWLIRHTATSEAPVLPAAGDDGTSKGDRAVDYSKNVDVEYMTYIWMVVLFLCGWYPLFILDDSHKKRRKKRIPKKNQPKESQLDIWAEYLYNLNQGQQTFLLAVGMLLFMYSGVAGGKISKHERHYWTNMNEGIMFLEREPVDYHQALEKFEAVLEEEYGQKKILPYLLYGQVKMELGDRGKCIEFLSKGFKKFPDPKKEELEDREGTEAFMVAAYRKIFDYVSSHETLEFIYLFADCPVLLRSSRMMRMASRAKTSSRSRRCY